MNDFIKHFRWPFIDFRIYTFDIIAIIWTIFMFCVYMFNGGKYVVMQYALRLTTAQISTFMCDLYPNDLV